MVIFVRSSNFNYDPRASKFLDFLERKQIYYRLIGWDRDGLKHFEENVDYLRVRAKYGQKYFNIPKKVIWVFYIIYNLIKRRKQYSVIHSVDIDSTLICLIMSKILKKKIVYDIYDWIGTNSKNDNFVIRLVEYLENRIVERVDAIIVCEKERIKQISASNLKKILIMPNIPFYSINFPIKNAPRFLDERLIISYVGVFDFNRGLENLLEVVSIQKNVELKIAGFGALEKLVIEFSNTNENIKFLGKISYYEALDTIRKSDLLYACYHLSNPVHKYAAPNKYYESLFTNTPVITTVGTLVSSKVLEFNTGFCIEESKDALIQLFNNRNLLFEIDKKSKNCKNLWENKYASYIENFLQNEYVPLLKNMK